MRLCIPVKRNLMDESEVYGHFGSAPAFILVDTDGNSITAIDNSDMGHTHGMCDPVKALGGHEVDGVVVAGIGGGALNRLTRKGIAVYKAAARTVRENVELFTLGRLEIYHPGTACPGHSGGCSHKGVDHARDEA
jgi:predicted Fe-Mo cluster-binding NifX family protein